MYVKYIHVHVYSKGHLETTFLPTLQVEEYLTEGTLVADFVLDSVGKLMNCLRECNVTLRWIMLHTAAGGQNSEVKGLKPILFSILHCWISRRYRNCT